MDQKEILSHVDHTKLSQTATWEEIRGLCDDALRYGTASVCIPPTFVRQCAEYLAGRLPVCTVIGFPNGYNTSAVKRMEAAEALADGADELDVVICLGDVKEGRYDRILRELRDLKQICGDRILKVIIETCLLTKEEKIRMCRIVTESGADFIKTSTGFSTGGATFHDVELFAKHVKPGVKIKAAGGISSLDDAEKFIELGASRLGTSRVVKIVKKLEAEEK